jgi:hypothetical protein
MTNTYLQPLYIMDANYIRKSDFDSKLGNDDFNSFVNEIKTLSGTSALYITKDNLEAVVKDEIAS